MELNLQVSPLWVPLITNPLSVRIFGRHTSLTRSCLSVINYRLFTRGMLESDIKENILKKEMKVSKASTEMSPWPSFIQERIELWDKLMETYKAEIASKELKTIKISLPDGKQFDGEAWRTTPYDIAQKISKGLADSAIISKVNGKVWDLDRPFEGDATLHLLKFEDEEAQQVFWHSSAHILGEAMERYCGGHLCYGPPIQEGFYYDMWHESRTISQDDFCKIDQIVKCAIKVNIIYNIISLTPSYYINLLVVV